MVIELQVMKKWNAQTLTSIPLAIGVLVFAAALLVDDIDSAAGDEFLARGFAVCWFTALVVWSRARKQVPPWSWLRYLAIYFALAAIFSVLQYVGHLQKTGELDGVIHQMERWQHELEDAPPR